MSGLFGQLTNSVDALTAASRSIETAGKNLANVNNPDYARQRVVYGSLGTIKTALGAESTGLQAVGIEQLRDSLMDKQVVREDSKLASYEGEQSAYERAQAALGQSIDSSSATGSTNGISESLSNFFNGFQGFATSPTDVGNRQTLVQYAGALTDTLNQTDANLAQVQSDLTTQATSDAGNANTLLSQIANLNTEIGRLEVNAPGSAVDLRDERQAKVESLGKLMSIQTQADTNGSGEISVSTLDGSGNSVPLVTDSTVLGSVAISGTTVTAGSPATVLALTGGSINGALTARDGAIKDLRDNLNALASQLITSVNSAYNPTAAVGKNFFTGTNAGNIAVNSSINATSLVSSSTGVAGDSDIAQAVASLANKAFSTSTGDAINGTFSQSYTNSVTALGQTLSTTNDKVSNQTTISKLVTTQRDSVSGVSMDEEMADLIKYQQAYQASARVIQTIDTLLSTVINSLGSSSA
jgi:flagellar hook-associated protein 1 FlgK